MALDSLDLADPASSQRLLYVNEALNRLATQDANEVFSTWLYRITVIHREITCSIATAATAIIVQTRGDRLQPRCARRKDQAEGDDRRENLLAITGNFLQRPGDVNSLIAHFGLGDAAIAETVRIEWPSGTVQEFPKVPAKQFLIVE